jgi:hypothetical protein
LASEGGAPVNILGVVIPLLVTLTSGLVPVTVRGPVREVVSHRLPPIAFTVMLPLDPNAIVLAFEFELLKNPVVSVKV